MQAILIDVEARSVRAVTHDGLADLQSMVGGSIATAWASERGDVVFVDDEGLFKVKKGFFRIRGVDQPMAGNGVMVGPDRYDAHGEYLGNDAPTLTLAQVAALVRFMTRAQVDAWAKANASEPAASFTNLDTGETTVFRHYGGLFNDMPREEED
jgi:Domain of unknown function (DUF3846)